MDRGEEHAAQAEALLSEATQRGSLPGAALWQQRAQVHATLAVYYLTWAIADG